MCMNGFIDIVEFNNRMCAQCMHEALRCATSEDFTSRREVLQTHIDLTVQFHPNMLNTKLYIFLFLCMGSLGLPVAGCVICVGKTHMISKDKLMSIAQQGR